MFTPPRRLDFGHGFKGIQRLLFSRLINVTQQNFPAAVSRFYCSYFEGWSHVLI